MWAWKRCCLLHFTGSYFVLKYIWNFCWSPVSRGALILIPTRPRLKLSFWCWPTLSTDDSPILLGEKCKAPFTSAFTVKLMLCCVCVFFSLPLPPAGSCFWIGSSLWPPNEGAQRDLQVSELQDRYMHTHMHWVHTPLEFLPHTHKMISQTNLWTWTDAQPAKSFFLLFFFYSFLDCRQQRKTR